MMTERERKNRGSSMVLGFGTILEYFGLGDITGVDVFFAAMAVIGTILFIIYFLLVMIGGVADGIADSIPFLDINLEMDAEGVFHMLTIQGLLSFMMMFGIFGLAASQADQNAIIAILAGSIAGVASMWIVGKVFQAVASLETDGTVVHSEAIGAKGTVYRRIEPGQTGQVQVEFQSALRTCNAVAEDDTMRLDTGKFVTVVGNISEMLIVRPLSISDAVVQEE
jgi:membrane protein implicated in regulation of membrane protease activity